MLLAAVAGCSRPAAAPAAIAGSSRTMVVRGSYAPVAIDRVDRLSLEDGKIVLHGSSSVVAIDPPPLADPARPDRHWALVTETDNGRARVLTFTHDESLDDFTIELPPSEAPVRYGGLSGRDGSDILVLAWGEQSRSYHAELTIVPIARPCCASPPACDRGVAPASRQARRGRWRPARRSPAQALRPAHRRGR
jgi:hypothetical protein